MIIYRLWTSSLDEGHCYEWFASNEEAGFAMRKRIREGTSPDAVKIDMLRLPDTKTGMIEWLNRNFTRDNG
jgi:hypothetical protein